MSHYYRTDPKDWPARDPRRKTVLLDMTDNMQTALIHCTSRGVTEDEFGPEKRWPSATRDALLRHGLIHLMRTRKGYKLWRPTDTGRGLVAAHVPSLLAAKPDRLRFKETRRAAGMKRGRHVVDEGATGGDYTHKPSEAMRGEGEAA